MTVAVTFFAAWQYQQMVAPKLTVAEARSEIMAMRWLDAAVTTGARVIQIGGRAKLILERNVVVEVLPPRCARTAGHKFGDFA